MGPVQRDRCAADLHSCLVAAGCVHPARLQQHPCGRPAPRSQLRSGRSGVRGSPDRACGAQVPGAATSLPHSLRLGRPPRSSPAGCATSATGATCCSSSSSWVRFWLRPASWPGGPDRLRSTVTEGTPAGAQRVGSRACSQRGGVGLPSHGSTPSCQRTAHRPARPRSQRCAAEQPAARCRGLRLQQTHPRLAAWPTAAAAPGGLARCGRRAAARAGGPAGVLVRGVGWAGAIPRQAPRQAVPAGEGPCLATYWVRRYWQLLLVRVLTGISLGGTFPLVFSLVGDLFFTSQRAGVAAGIQLATGAGFAAGQGIAGFVGAPPPPPPSLGIALQQGVPPALWCPGRQAQLQLSAQLLPADSRCTRHCCRSWLRNLVPCHVVPVGWAGGGCVFVYVCTCPQARVWPWPGTGGARPHVRRHAWRPAVHGHSCCMCRPCHRLEVAIHHCGSAGHRHGLCHAAHSAGAAPGRLRGRAAGSCLQLPSTCTGSSTRFRSRYLAPTGWMQGRARRSCADSRCQRCTP